MTEWGVVGVIVVLVGLFGSMFGSLYKLFFQPIQTLDITLNILNETIKNMSALDQARDGRLEEHKGVLIQHSDKLSEHDKRIGLTERDIAEIKNTNYMKDRIN